MLEFQKTLQIFTKYSRIYVQWKAQTALCILEGFFASVAKVLKEVEKTQKLHLVN